MKFIILAIPLLLLGCGTDDGSGSIYIPERGVWVDFSTSLGTEVDRARDSVMAKSGNHLRMERLTDDQTVTFLQATRRVIWNGEEEIVSQIEDFIPFDGLQFVVESATEVREELIRGIPVYAYYLQEEDYRMGVYISREDRLPLREVIVNPDGSSHWTEYFWIAVGKVSDEWFETKAPATLLRTSFADEIEHSRSQFIEWKQSLSGPQP